MPSKRLSAWKIAGEQLARARETDWSDPGPAASAWARLGEIEARLLVPARHADDLKDKLNYLLAVSDPPQSRSAPGAERSLKLKLLYSAVKDAIRIAEQSEWNQRCEALRRHAARLGSTEDLAAQVSALRRDLNEVRAERDAAYRALERRNGFAAIEHGYSPTSQTRGGAQDPGYA